MIERVIRPTTLGKARFGSTLAADEPYLVVGASARDSTYGLAAACLYDTASWQLVAGLANTRTDEYAGFADAVTVSARLGLVAVSSPGYEIGDGPVHVFERASEWQRPRLLVNPEDPRHRGESYWAEGLAFVGDVLAAGAALTEDTGITYLLDRATGAPRIIRPSGPGGEFGHALAACGDVLAVGAPMADRVGRVYIYACGQLGARELAQLVPAAPVEHGEYGAALALTERYLAVGAPRRGGGFVELWQRRDDAFARVATLTPPEPHEIGLFGLALACDGRRLAIGEPGGPNRRGRVWRYDLAGETPRALGAWQPADLADDEWFGSALALGPGWLAAGAPSDTALDRFGRVVVRDW